MKRSTATFFLGVVIAGGIGWLAAWALRETARSEFCMRCHTMALVGENGWKQSRHYDNPTGVVASCADCHVPPEFLPMLWARVRDGTSDLMAHFFGETNPEKINWDRLRLKARAKISDSACRKCHANLLPSEMSLEGKVAHRAYESRGLQRCLDCHADPLHDAYRKALRHESSADVSP